MGRRDYTLPNAHSIGINPLARLKSGKVERGLSWWLGDWWNGRQYLSSLSAAAHLAMTALDTETIEGEIDRIRLLGLEELRHQWRRLYHAEPPRISRDLLVLALG